MKKIVAGIFAHVDAGKTTLSEGLLYTSGTIRNHGRVDNGDTFLDTYELEKKRGITIFSKQARFSFNDTEIVLVDTPGHVDFSAEMERSIRVIDYGILVISGTEGVEAHTETLWKLFKRNKKPLFIFVNKMDMQLANKTKVFREICDKLSENAIDFVKMDYEKIAFCDELLMEEYLENGEIKIDSIAKSISKQNIFPVFFGSALKLEGVKEFMEAIDKYIIRPEYNSVFSGLVYKINRDGQNRITFIKITGGSIKVKDVIEEYGEKIDQIRLYSGEKYVTVNEAFAGELIAVTGLTKSKYGDVIGEKQELEGDVLNPVMNYTLYLEDGVDSSKVYKEIKELDDELPELSIQWVEENRTINLSIMGEIQLEIVKNLIMERYGINVSFGLGRIIYKETIGNVVEGVGHFEPLRHYAEVQLRLEPLERGSGIEYSSECSEDELAKNWQRLIFTHIEEKVHLGVLTGSALTDVKIVLTGGKAHNKHTEGGDFRQATYRAIRQGLMQAENILLEPYHKFEIEIPRENIGRAMTDLGNMNAKFETPEEITDVVTINGRAPYSKIAEYSKEITAYSKGRGKISFRFDGYGVCCDGEEVVKQIGYIPENDIRNTADSVFCAHGAGYVVHWSEVSSYMHVPSKLHNKNNINNDENDFLLENIEESFYINPKSEKKNIDNRDGYEKDLELKEIFERTYGTKNKESLASGKRKVFKKSKPEIRSSQGEYVYKPKKKEDEYLLVDGYNIIFAWDDLKSIALTNMDAARDKLLDIMSNYQGYMGMNLMVVFDAYKVRGFKGEHQRYNNIDVIFTKEAETADAFIEKFAHENGRKYNVRVATSDGIEQIIITGQGCNLFSAREFKNEIIRVNQLISEKIERL